MFQPVEPSVNLPNLETEIGRLWKEQGIYDKSLAQRAGDPRFVFYEGPPTANGMPHPGHCLTRAVKDLFPRYKTMRGYLCERKAGWDTHGLPVEVEVCKELGIHSKEEIEAYGVEPFIQKCQQSVWRYMQEWERLTDRLGFWIHQDEAYVTYHQSYVESVWWSLKNFFDRGLLYQGHKIVWWWAQGGTALSAGEVGQGYREVGDPSAYVKFPLLDDEGNKTDTSLIVWTTTPWTLPSNQFAAVNPKLEYSVVVDQLDDTTTQRLIVASDLVEAIAAKVKREFTVEKTLIGSELVGKQYEPPFDCFASDQQNKTGTLRNKSQEPLAWRIVSADFVTTESGSGIVHQAPAFGEVDYDVLVAEQSRFVEGAGPKLINCVAPNGTFTDEGPDYCQGRWVKDCDKDIIRDLRERGLLFHQEQYLHDYPFCWRAPEDPLIQYPRESWFIRTTQFKDQMLANNAEINWMPEHIKEGRFGNFLEGNIDWTLSRERYWGTPLPIWVCQKTGKQEAICSYEELLAKPGVEGADVWEKAKAANPELPDDLRVHKPYIDAVTYSSPFAKGARMQRVPEVIDCWYDSGAMPFAQWGYQGQAEGPVAEKFQEQFPADFISEALDQTRGWFYSQLAISTMLFGEESGEASRVHPDEPKPGDSEQETGDRRQESGIRNHPLPPHTSPLTPYPLPFRNCIVLGLMNAEWWQSKDGKTQFLTESEAKASGTKYNHKIGKMSKSLRNYRSPQEIFDTHGADALRWYFFANQPPWTSIIYSERAIKESVPEFLLRLWNVYSFFVIYANIDEFNPGEEVGGQRSEIGELGADVLSTGETWRPPSERAELHQWILGELNRMCRDVTAKMDEYDNYGACQSIIQFVDALSNWYVRRSRERFWSADKRSSEKLDCYWTLYECLLTTSKLIAPFVPFFAESLWQNLATAIFGEKATESVHLCDYPTGDESLIDDQLASHMALGREISSLGRSARMNAKLKVRQPLSKVEIILVNPEDQSFLEPHNDLICEELNVKQVEYTQNADHYIEYTVLPNFKRLGPRVGKNIPVVKKQLATADGAELLASLQSPGKITLDLPDGEKLELDEEDIEVRLKAKEGWAAAQGKQCVVVLSTELTEELIQEGIARDIIRFIQDQRKSSNLDYEARINMSLFVQSPRVYEAIENHCNLIQGEVLASKLSYSDWDATKDLPQHKVTPADGEGCLLGPSTDIDGQTVLLIFEN